MALTVRALLEDGMVSSALSVVVAGSDGSLDREVLWLHTTELGDPSAYIRVGELVLTNGLWLTSTPAEQFVSAVAATGAVGLVFGLTDRFPHAPDTLVAACLAADLLLGVVATSVPFTVITEAAARIQSATRQQALEGLVRRGNSLASAIARGGGADGVLAVLRRDHDLPLVVVDRMGRQLAGIPVSEEFVTGAVEALTRRPPPLEVGSTDGLRASVFLVEGALGDVDAGVFCLRSLADLSIVEREAIEQAARFLSLEVTKQQALQAIESRFASEVLEMVLSGAARASEVRDRLRTFGIDPFGPLAVMTLTVGDGRVRPPGSTDEVEAFLAAAGLPAVVVAGSSDTVAVFPWAHPAGELVDVGTQLIATLTARFPGQRVVVGIGDVAADSGGLREPLVGSREVCHVLRRRHGDSRVGTSADIATHRMLLGLHDPALVRRFADDLLGPLRDHDLRYASALVRTLEVFLGNDGRWAPTAAELYIHVNTLRNRMSRIADLTGRDPNRLEDRVDLFLAVEADALG